jgi:hypothetical protein
LAIVAVDPNKMYRIGVSPKKNPWVKPSTAVPTTVHLPLYSPFLWTQQTMFDGWDAHPMPMGFSWGWFLGYCGCWSQKMYRIGVSPSQNPWGKPCTGPNHCPPTTLFSILMTPTNNVWWMRCPSNASESHLELVSWLLRLLIPKKDSADSKKRQDWLNSKQKSMRQTI